MRVLRPSKTWSLVRHTRTRTKSSTAIAPRATVQPNQLAQTAFTALGIDHALYEEVGGVRVRQHVNPLKRELQQLPAPPDWASSFKDPSLPLVVDVGSGYGRFLLALKHTMPTHNMVGLEIRHPVIDRANKWAESLGSHKSVFFIMANATISLQHLLESYPGQLDLVTVQYPDPHFKKRHHKRRIVQPQLVDAAAALLRPGGRVLLQSDVLEVAEDMRNRFEQGAAHCLEPCKHTHASGSVFFEVSSPKPPALHPEETENADSSNGTSSTAEIEKEEHEDVWESQWATAGWLKDNPLGVPTERELHTLNQGKPVYRCLLRKM